MEQQFVLKHRGNLGLWEQNNMTAEERAWWIKRLNKEAEREEKAVKDAQRRGPRGH